MKAVAILAVLLLGRLWGPPLQSPASPLTATLSLPSVPPAGEPARLDITVAAISSAPGTTVELVLPDGASLEGPGRWTVDLEPGAPQTLSTTVRFSRTGEQEVLARLRRPIDANNSWEGQGGVRVTIEASVTGRPATATPPTALLPPTPPGAPAAPGPTPICPAAPVVLGLVGALLWYRRRPLP